MPVQILEVLGVAVPTRQICTAMSSPYTSSRRWVQRSLAGDCMRVLAVCQGPNQTVAFRRRRSRYRRKRGYDPLMRRKWFVPVVSAVLAAVVFMVVFGLLAFILILGESA